MSGLHQTRDKVALGIVGVGIWTECLFEMTSIICYGLLSLPFTPVKSSIRKF
jgi:hypothetical protein